MIPGGALASRLRAPAGSVVDGARDRPADQPVSRPAVVVRLKMRGPDRTGFRLVMAAALLLAVQLVATAGRLTG